MQKLGPRRVRRFRSVWLSDVHLGFRGCSAEFLRSFLKSIECDQLYLVGDIVDIWQMKKRPYWPQAHNDVVRVILGKAKFGTKVIYIPGNHDELLRDFAGHDFGNISIEREVIHTKTDGSRLLVLHGDKFDAAVTSSRWLGVLGSTAYELLLHANIVVNWCRRRLGFGHWSLAKYLKYKVKNAVQAISNYEAAVVHDARKRGVQGVVCGHIHRPEITTIGDITYCNCGDWVESCSALVEHLDGTLEIVVWNDEAESALPVATDLAAA